jgi:hypothetical protein
MPGLLAAGAAQLGFVQGVRARALRAHGLRARAPAAAHARPAGAALQTGLAEKAQGISGPRFAAIGRLSAGACRLHGGPRYRHGDFGRALALVMRQAGPGRDAQGFAMPGRRSCAALGDFPAPRVGAGRAPGRGLARGLRRVRGSAGPAFGRRGVPAGLLGRPQRPANRALPGPREGLTPPAQLQVLCHSEHGAALCCRTPAFVQGLLQSIHDPLVGDEALRMVGGRALFSAAT